MPRELPCHAPAARAALQRELQCLTCTLVGLAPAGRGLDAEMIEPSRDRGEVVVLRKRIERHPQAEAFGQRHLLLDRLARVYLVTFMTRLEVFGEVFGQQMTAVRRRVDEHVA